MENVKYGVYLVHVPHVLKSWKIPATLVCTMLYNPATNLLLTVYNGLGWGPLTTGTSFYSPIKLHKMKTSMVFTRLSLIEPVTI